MKFSGFFVLLLISMSVMASEIKPSITAQLAANKDSPTETDLVVVVANTTKGKVSLALPRYDGELFQILNLNVTTLDGQLVPLSDRGKAIKAGEVMRVSERTVIVAPGGETKVNLSLSQFFVLPPNGKFTVFGSSKNLVWLGDKPNPIEFTSTKSSD